MPKIIIDITGSLGLIMILAAFFLLQRRKLSDDSDIYNLLNIFGGLMIAVYTFSYSAYISVILNVVWSAVAVVDLVQNHKKDKIQSSQP